MEKVLDPAKTDFLYRFIRIFGRSNPVLTTLSYFFLSYGGLYLLGFLSGRLHGHGEIAAMYSSVIDNINLAFVAPVGAGVLCLLYNRISWTFSYVKSQLLQESGEIGRFDEFIKRLSAWYNSKIVFAVCIILGFGPGIYNYFQKTDSWLGINGGLVGVYGRFWVCANFFMIAYIFCKCVVSVVGLWKVFNFHIDIQPMHPDRCGGLKPLGSLAIVVNYFLGLVVVYFGLQAFFDPFVTQKPAYLFLFVAFYILSPALMVGSLFKGYRKMKAAKNEIMERLGTSFDHYYKQLLQSDAGGVFDLEKADEISKIHALYEVAHQMPLWPFDFKSLSRLLATITIPFALYVFDQLGNPDSLLYKMDIFARFLSE